jgi:hypothetical protein
MERQICHLHAGPNSADTQYFCTLSIRPERNPGEIELFDMHQRIIILGHRMHQRSTSHGPRATRKWGSTTRIDEDTTVLVAILSGSDPPL